jgi:hypothetical protein
MLSYDHNAFIVQVTATAVVSYDRNNSYSTGHSLPTRVTKYTPKFVYRVDTLGPMLQKIYDRKLRIFVIR